jgi:hypothetical protein
MADNDFSGMSSSEEEFTVNFVDVSEGFDILPAGWYPVRIVGHETRKTSADAKKYKEVPMINWAFEVTGDFKRGRKLWTNTVVVPELLGQIKGMLRATGEFTDEQLNSSDFVLRPKDYYKMELAAKVRVKKYEGEDRNDILAFKAIANVADDDWASEDSSTVAGAASLLP